MTTTTELLETIGGLSAPAKMPCHSWSIPATECKLGALLRKREGSTCHSCYALKGMYVMPNVRAAMERRLAILREAMADGQARLRFVREFSEVLNRKAETTRKRVARGQTVRRDGRFFRWHDAGDLQGPAHLSIIADIAQRTPDVRHWLPTREVGQVAAWVRSGAYRPANLMIRLSAPMVDQEPAGLAVALARNFEGIAHSSVSHHHLIGELCIAPSQDGECRDCRRCWDAGRENISYHLH